MRHSACALTTKGFGTQMRNRHQWYRCLHKRRDRKGTSILLILCTMLMLSACEPPPFDPEGYKCTDASKHCLQGYACINERCIKQTPEPAQEQNAPDGGTKESTPTEKGASE
ncbi:MAG TPA: hypothetical protein DCE42_03330 [Myxococcales bacterium]|nr:hypothetical protein [Myxococcales bacterium]